MIYPPTGMVLQKNSCKAKKKEYSSAIKGNIYG